MAESAVVSVVRAFGTLAAEEAAFLRGVHDDADLLRAELRRMQCFLRDADARRRGRARITNWVVDVRAAAYDAEDALEEAVHHALRRRSLRLGFVGFLPWCAHLFALHGFGVRIRGVHAKIRQIADGAAAYGITDLGETSAPTDVHDHEHEVTPYNLQWDGEPSLVVGFHEEKHMITEELINPDIKQIFVVSIVGMSGSGKSTLARKIYDFSHVRQQFHAFSWVVVSQKYKFLDLIKKIAKGMMGITRRKVVRKTTNDNEEGTSTSRQGQSTRDREDASHEVSIEELEQMGEEEVKKLLHQFLACRRFLLVLDDVWRNNSYSEINRIINFMPDSENGSRIMLTTQHKDVAMHVNKRSSIHEMKLLDERQSWELLDKKAFPEYQNVPISDRSRLTLIGKKLAVKCKGLPLALVVLGGYLSRNLDHDIWSGLVDNLDWETRKDDEPIWRIIARSYNDLPNHQLKSCFLYIASFPEDYIIRVARLCKLWTAEGIIPQRPKRTMEETGREYINELAQRCMLQAVERSKVHGSIKSVVLHDLLRDWGVAEARREGLFNVWNSPTDGETFSDSIPAYRVALHNFSGHLGIDVTMPKLRTLLVFFKLPTISVLRSLKYLRVLELYGLVGLEKLPSSIGQLMHLRYLGLQKCGDRPVCIPSSVSDLLNLQTLDARGSAVRSLPLPFWNIPTLRHLFFGEVNFWAPPEVGCLRSLQTLYLCEICVLEDVDRHQLTKYKRAARSVNKSINQSNRIKWASFLEALEEMKQLVLLHLDSWTVYEVFGKHRRGEGRERREVLSAGLGVRVSGHKYLRVLELAGIWKHGIAELTKLPQGLKKLKLIGSRLSEDPMPVLGMLPNLVVLVLEDNAYVPKGNMTSMTCHADGFPRLQHLTFHGIRDVESWNVEAGAFASLAELNLIYSFGGMALPPPGLLHVASLRLLHLKPVYGCTVSTENVRELRVRGCKVEIERYVTRYSVDLQGLV